MKSIGIIKHFSILFCILSLGIQLVCANETFQNNLLKADFYKTSLGAIKVTLYTSKPYNDSVVVNKKSDFEYVILIPEMSNSMTANPILNPVADVVKAVNIKTQQYENNIKGYTKITVFTKKPIEIEAQVQTLKTSEYSLSESDYKELLAQTAKKKIEQVKPKKETVKSFQKPKTYVVSKTIDKRITKLSNRLKPRVKKSTVVSKKIQRVKPFRRVVETKPVQKVKLTQKPVGPIVSSDLITAQKIETPKIETPAVEKVAPIAEEVNLPEQVQTPATPIQTEGRLHKYKRIIKNNLYAILSLFFITFLFLLLIARKITKNIQKRKEVFASNLSEKPLNVTDFSEKITDDMTWKEKFQTYVDVKNQTLQEDIQGEEQIIQSNEDLDELFDTQHVLKEEVSEKSFDESENIEKEIPQEQIIEDELQEATPEFGLDETNEFMEINNLPEFNQEVSIDELFGEEEDFIVEENKEKAKEEITIDFDTSVETTEEAEDIKEPDEIIKSEFIIDEEKGFYLVDFENKTALVGHIDDEIFVLKQFDKKIQGPIKARLDEKKNNSTSYMTKFGDFRGVVEVTPEKMNLLIEL